MLGPLDRLRLLALGIGREDLAAYRFGVDRPLSDAPRYLGYARYLADVRPALNEKSLLPLTENKWVFYRLMAGFEMNIPPTLGLYDPLFGCTWAGQSLRTAEAVLALLDEQRPAGLVIKPAGGQMGRDLLILTEINYDSGHCVTRTEESVGLSKAVAGLAPKATRSYPGYILQEFVSQHRDLAAVNPHTANTVRVVTLLTSDDVVIQASALRLGRAGKMADNWEQGGISAYVDPASGVVGDGVIKPKHGGHVVSAHPDTGVEFRGLTVPLWDQVISLCRRAARLLVGVRSIGWDVLITDEGPVLLEANGNWDLRLSQVHSTGFLADPLFRRELEAAGVHQLPSRLPSRSAAVANAATMMAGRAGHRLVDALRPAVGLRRRRG